MIHTIDISYSQWKFCIFRRLLCVESAPRLFGHYTKTMHEQQCKAPQLSIAFNTCSIAVIRAIIHCKTTSLSNHSEAWHIFGSLHPARFILTSLKNKYVPLIIIDLSPLCTLSLQVLRKTSDQLSKLVLLLQLFFFNHFKVRIPKYTYNRELRGHIPKLQYGT